MNNIARKTSIPLGAIIIAALLIVGGFFVFATRSASADSSQKATNGHLITIHDKGNETVISTQAKTIGDALKEAGVVVDKSDSVEPSVDEVLVASEYQVNIYRARPVIVVDGTTRLKIITPFQTAGQIAQSAGITLYAEDRAVVSRTDNLVSEGAGLQLTITRAIPFSFTLYGATTTARTQATTVRAMLQEKGITLGKDDRVSPDGSTPLTAETTVRVWREGKQTLTVDEEVAFDIEKIQDGDQEVGYHAIKTPGQKGSKNVTYEIVIQDGKEVARTQIASITTREFVKQVEIVGAKFKGAYTTPGENEIITWNFLIGQGFTREQTAGIMGNLKQEHGFNTTGDGLVQWTGRRKTALLSRPDPYNIYTQLDFLMYELNGGYRSVQNAIRASTTVAQSVVIFQNQFEGCGVCAESQRIQFAYNILASH